MSDRKRSRSAEKSDGETKIGDSDDESLFATNSEGLDNIAVSKLCSNCQYIFDDWHQVVTAEEEFTFSHYNSVEALDDSAKEGCALCVQFWQSAVTHSHEARASMARKVRREPRRGFKGSVEVTAEVSGLMGFVGQGSQECWRLRWRLESDEQVSDDSFSDDLDPTKIMQLDVLALPALGYAKVHKESSEFLSTKIGLHLSEEWLKRCSATHRLCNPNGTQPNPTRLLQLDAEGLRLCVSTELSTRVRYATLSHCWGSSPLHTVLTKDSLEIFRTRVPIEALSKTFLDAIHITRTLKIEYLWIDSLCIIQHDPTDWRKESALMGSVYGGSTINIAASGARDGTIGCFFDRNPSWRCQIQTVFNGSQQLYDCVSAGMYDNNLSHMPLYRRGWTLQERLLAPRTLHFTSTQVFWECYQKTTCEAFPERLPQLLTNTRNYLFKKPLERSMWEWVAERYTKCKLSIGTDKLIAVSGLARIVQAKTKDQYAAGLWREEMELQLCWYKLIDHQGDRSSPYVAPTWSWASIEGGVKFYDMTNWLEGQYLNIKVLRVGTTPVGADPLGEISDGFLDLSCSHLLRGVIHEGYYQRNLSGLNTLVFGKETLEVIVYFDYSNIFDRTLYVLPIKGYGGGERIMGLMLQPTGFMRGEYRRIALFVIVDKKACQTFENVAQSRMWQREDKKYSRIQMDKYGRRHQIIRLI